MNHYEPSNDNIPAAEMAFARYQASVAIDNQAFARASAANKRVAIAKDVLAWLKLGQLKAKKGVYLATSAASKDDLQTGEKCNACALGAIFACTALKTEEISLRDDWGGLNYSHGMREKLAPYFDYDQLLNIENAFEGRRVMVNLRCDFEDEANFSDAALDFNRGVRSPRKRMERIMRNIIRNGGDFRP